MRILVVSTELPYPATHGGRVDIWSRLQALAAAGAQLHLVCWANQFAGEQVDDASRQAMLTVMNGITVFPMNRVFAYPAMLLRYPSSATIRYVDDEALKPEMAAISAFDPQAVWLDGLGAGLLAVRLAARLQVPLFYRSQNIEHRYVTAQFRRTRGARNRLVGLTNVFTTLRFEQAVLRAAQRYFDISSADLDFWQKHGFDHGQWLPPIVDLSKALALSDEASWRPAFDVAYVGNLYAPNNVEGVLWFLCEVLPLLRAQRPELSLLIVGSRPIPEVLAAAAQGGATVVASPDDVVPHLRNARVLVNPVFAGSGVNIKSVEMLFTPAALVSTSTGLQGLPAHVCAEFAKADSAQAFAAAVVGALAAVPCGLPSGRALARECFSPNQGVALVVQMQARVRAADSDRLVASTETA